MVKRSEVEASANAVGSAKAGMLSNASRKVFRSSAFQLRNSPSMWNGVSWRNGTVAMTRPWSDTCRWVNRDVHKLAVCLLKPLAEPYKNFKHRCLYLELNIDR